MTVLRRAAMVRWALVAVTAAVLVSIPSIVASLPISGSEPAAGVLRERIVASADEPYTGYVRSQAELGLPSLPDFSDVTSLLSGLTDMRVWYRSPSLNRVDVIDTIGERDVYQTPGGVYTWDYASNLLTEVVGDEPIRLPRAGDLVPGDLARRILSMDPVDPVVSLPTRRIAGVTAAGLRLRPTDAATTIGQVDIWADPDSGIPLRVEVTARGAAKPILTSQFMDFDRTNPDDGTLSPPIEAAGGVSVAPAPDLLRAIGQVSRFGLPTALDGYARQPQLPGLPSVGRYGDGLASFVVLPLPRNVGSSAIDTMTKAGGIPVTVARGRAVLIKIPLLTVLVEQVGFGRRTYLVAGFVDQTALQEAAIELATIRRPFG
ncbi:MAG TPA: hypothetical protein VH333_24205 [Pseudonocardiaceae bacterium]|nr:hypothetical protein [Pseudonocardiaceae bacterium]